MQIADQDYWLDASGQVVNEEPASGSLIAKQGTPVDAKLVKRHDLKLAEQEYAPRGLGTDPLRTQAEADAAASAPAKQQKVSVVAPPQESVAAPPKSAKTLAARKVARKGKK